MKVFLKHYMNGWYLVLRNWHILLLLFGVNMFFSFFVTRPLSQFIESSFGSAVIPNDLGQSFDYTVWMEIIRHNNIAANIVLAGSINALLLYFLWLSFISGGLVRMVVTNRKLSIADFIEASAQYWFRYIRLGLFIIMMTLIVIVIAFLIFVSGGLHFLEFESQDILAHRVYGLLCGIGLFIWLISIFRDLTKISIYNLPAEKFSNSLKIGFKQMITWGALMTGILFFILTIFLFILFLIAKKVEVVIVIVLVGQLFVLFRIGHRIGRLYTYYRLVKES